jgi:pimeloyl-ACP methyl ester carboxylesterase
MVKDLNAALFTHMGEMSGRFTQQERDSVVTVLKIRGGQSVAWTEYGARHGQPVFYFHGLPGSREEARSAQRVASELHIRLIAVDRFGYGESVAQRNPTLLEWAESIGELADHLNLPSFAVLGFSGGAPHALACAFVLGDRVTHLSLVGALAEFSTPVAQAHFSPQFKPLYELAAADPEACLRQLEQMVQGPGDVIQLIQSNLAADDQRLFADQGFTGFYSDNIHASLAQGVVGAARDLNRLGSSWGFDIDAIDCDTALWHGVQDRSCGVAIADYLAETIPHSTLHKLADKGHFFLFENWREILGDLVARGGHAQ